jgi:hypothetical protein
MKRTTAAGLWFAAVLTLIVGAFGVVILGERRIADQMATNDGLAAQLATDSAIVSSRGALLVELSGFRVRLRQLGAVGRPTPAVARFVHDAARVAQQHHTTISSIAAPASAGTARGRTEPYDALPLAVTVEGRYADVLAVTRALSGLPVPAEIDLLSVVRTARPGAVSVAAALRVVLQRTGFTAISDVGGRPD